MSNLNNIISVSITRQTVYPSVPGFAAPMVAVYHTAWDALARQFTSPNDVAAALQAGGLTANQALAHPAYRATQAIMSQNPRPAYVVIGRRQTPSTQLIKLTPKTLRKGFTYTFSITDEATGLAQVVTYTNGNSETAQTIATAIGAAIMTLASTDIASAVATTGVLLVTMNVGKLVQFTGLPAIGDMTFQDTSTDPGIAADLLAIYNAALAGWSNGLSFYGVLIDHSAALIVAAAAAWIEAQNLFYLPRTTDSICTDPVNTTDVLSVLKAGGYKRTAALFDQYGNMQFSDCAWWGDQATNTPGTNTWALKTPAGVFPSILADAEAAAIEGKNGTWFRPLGGLNLTFESKTAFGEFIDIQIFADYLSALIQTTILGYLANQKKVDYTDRGGAVLGGLVQGILNANISDPISPRGLSGDPAPTVTVPKVRTQQPADRDARRFKGITFGATLSGAIHGATIQGNLSV